MTAAILGAIQQGATYGYAIHRALGDAGLGVRLNHLYPVLRRMEDEGLITSSVVEGERGPNRRAYALTADGRKRLEERLVDSIAVVRPPELGPPPAGEADGAPAPGPPS